MPDVKKTTAQSDLLAKWKQRKKTTPRSAIGARPEGVLVSPTSGQRRLWLLQELYPENAFYQYGHLYRFSGPLRAELLEESFRTVFARHEILRSNYVDTQEGVALTVKPETTFVLERTDLSGQPAEERERLAHQEASSFTARLFNLAEDTLLRALLIQLGPETHWLVVSIHHIIGDRASLLVLNDELYQTYSGLVRGEAVKLPAITAQFPDFAHWKNQKPTSEKSLAYWSEELSGALPHTPLPFDRPRRPEATFTGRSLLGELPPDKSDLVHTLAKSAGTTANVVLLAAYQTLLLRYGAPKDLTVGTPVSIRDRTELEHMIGFLNETVVLRSRFDDPTETFRSFVLRVKEKMETALEHKDVSFDELVKHLAPPRVPGANPMFQNMFVYNADAPAAKLPAGLTVAEEVMDIEVSKFDLTLFATNFGANFGFTLEYATDLFDNDTAERLLSNFTALLSDAVSQPDTPLAQLNIFGEAEKVLRQDWNQTATDLPRPDTILELILAAAKKTPQAIAVADSERQLSYADLLQRADLLADTLLKKGIQPGAAVGLYTDRRVEMIVGIIGILRAGAAYVPLDPAYPTGRIAYVAEDAGIKTIVTLAELKTKLDQAAYDLVEIPAKTQTVAFTPPVISADGLAYLIYTSGSTGKAKGVAINHANLVHSTTARFAYFEHQPRAFLLMSSFAFDSSVAGIFWTLSQGGKLVIPPVRIEQDLNGLAGLIEQHEVSHTLMLPSLYQLLLEFSQPEQLVSLRTVMVAGEACSSAVVMAHYEQFPRVELVNEYGPTEGTVWCTAHRIRAEDAGAPVPIGRPIPNVQNYVLDAGMQPVPVGVPGELYIAGPGLATGYWQQPELTAERFPTVHLGEAAGAKRGSESRLYRTGDLAKYRKTGLIDFLGRADHQIKIRGFRVELDEISRHLDRLPEVREAVTLVNNSGSAPRLLAFYTLRTPLAKNDLRAALSQELPAYMVPASLVELDEFPRLPNGKVDQKALPLDAEETGTAARPVVEPTTETEKILAATWEKVLKRGPVSVDDNYFDVGGDSIRSIRIISLAAKRGLALKPHHIFTYQTVRELAAVVDRETEALAAGSAEASTVVPLRRGNDEAPLFCIHAGGGHVFFYQPLAKFLPGERPVYAIQPHTLAGEETLPASIAEMAADYLREMQKVQPKGPYHLLGTCFSNAVVLELAHQLTAAGQEVGSLFFIDSGPTRLDAVAPVRFSPIYTMMRILREGNWKLLRRSLYRYWFYTKQALGVPLEDEQGKTLRLTINGLYKLYSDYNWKPVEQELILIRSTQFAGDPGKKFHTEQLTQLAGGGLKTRVTEGTHGALFAEPFVEGLAQTIEECLRESSATEH
jgi:amino acid adenylation domain-containing protein